MVWVIKLVVFLQRVKEHRDMTLIDSETMVA